MNSEYLNNELSNNDFIYSGSTVNKVDNSVTVYSEITTNAIGSNGVIYNPIVTALTRKTLSVPMRYLKEHNLLKGEILDYGAGKFGDVIRLNKMGYNVYGYEPNYNSGSNKQLKIINKKFETITCNYVLNVIKDWNEAKNLIQNISKHIKPYGHIYITVRSDIQSVKNNWQYIEEDRCYKTNISYQRFFSEELIREITNNRYKIIKFNKNFIIFEYFH